MRQNHHYHSSSSQTHLIISLFLFSIMMMLPSIHSLPIWSWFGSSSSSSSEDATPTDSSVHVHSAIHTTDLSPVPPIPSPLNVPEEGECSFWNPSLPGFYSYDPDDLTGFHRQAPIGSYMTVINEMDPSRKVVVRIIGNNPNLADGRVLELSPSAFSQVSKLSETVFDCLVTPGGVGTRPPLSPSVFLPEILKPLFGSLGGGGGRPPGTGGVIVTDLGKPPPSLVGVNLPGVDGMGLGMNMHMSNINKQILAGERGDNTYQSTRSVSTMSSSQSGGGGGCVCSG